MNDSSSSPPVHRNGGPQANPQGVVFVQFGTRNQQASDLHLAVGQPPLIRLASDQVKIKGEPFTAEETRSMLREVLSEDQWQRLEVEQQLDFCHYIPRAGRYRGNVFVDHRGLNAVFRVIPEKPPTITEIGLPSRLAEIADYNQGLVIVCGPSGSGKSTTLAAIGNMIREGKTGSIISAIQTGVNQGMIEMDASIRALFEEGIVDAHAAHDKAINKEFFKDIAGEQEV